MAQPYQNRCDAETGRLIAACGLEDTAADFMAASTFFPRKGRHLFRPLFTRAHRRARAEELPEHDVQMLRCRNKYKI
jgi:hypothetical protein